MYGVITIFCGVFGIVYEQYSHGVFSPFMGLLFLFPLLGGFFPFLILSSKRVKKLPSTMSRYTYHSGLATLTTGSLLTGVFDIYGTTAPLVNVYWFVGSLFTVGGIVLYIQSLHKQKRV